MRFFGYFKDGAILQRDAPVLVRGYADGDVECRLDGGKRSQIKRVSAEKGRFRVQFEPVTDTHATYTLTATCGEEKISVNVRFGDVYLALGQSNMSYCLSATEEWEEWQRRASKTEVSFLHLEEGLVNEKGEIIRPAHPREEFSADYAWTTGDSERLPSISALCVQAAVTLSERQKIPIAFVQTAMGGLSVDTYLPRQAVESDEILLSRLKEGGRYVTIDDYNTSAWANFTQLSGVYNEKVAPLVGLSFKGIVWYLGESSAFNLYTAETFLLCMKKIRREYAKTFGDIPFVAVQIAPEYYPYGDKYGYLYINDALTRLQKEEKGVISIPVYDVEPRWLKPNGDLYFHPIHPINKAPIGLRIADALSGKRTAYPEIAEVEYLDGEAICRVANVDDGLVEGEYQGFTLAGENGKYYPAKAEQIAGDKIRVSSVDVKQPKKLTYAFMQYQDFCNARTVNAAPLTPYRSDWEAVDERYCFPPAYTVNGATEVYENNFGWQVGTCRKVPLWKEGSLYNGAKTQRSVKENALCITATPTAEEYFLFGVSPTVCLTGHKNHFDSYDYWNFRLRAEGKAELLGVIFRTADGEMYRSELYDGEEKSDGISLTEEYQTYTTSLKEGLSGD